MLNDPNNKSSRSTGESSRSRAGAVPPKYVWLGVAVLLAGEILMIMRVPLVTQWFTPIMWTGYILIVDGLIRWRKGTSLLSDHPLEFVILAVISIGSWAIFEGYNVPLKNWTYIGLPDNMVVRYIGYAWAFATISPVMFLTYELLDIIVPGETPSPGARLGNGVFWGFVIFGLACLVVPLVWPSYWMTPLVWIGFAFFLDPINGRQGERSFLSEFFTGHFRSMLLMFLAGFICGIFWEFWNYWATTKWEYHVPYLGHIKLFEMPVLGFLGFMPFAVESYAIYIFVRRLLPIKRPVKYLG
jgi:hypothetical protein